MIFRDFIYKKKTIFLLDSGLTSPRAYPASDSNSGRLLGQGSLGGAAAAGARQAGHAGAGGGRRRGAHGAHPGGRLGELV